MNLGHLGQNSGTFYLFSDEHPLSLLHGSNPPGYLFLQTVVLQKKVVGCPCHSSYYCVEFSYKSTATPSPQTFDMTHQLPLRYQTDNYGSRAALN